METTDKERLDFLQKLTDQNRSAGKVVLRISTMGRGWRLHEVSNTYDPFVLDGDVSSDVRTAIDNFMSKMKN